MKYNRKNYIGRLEVLESTSGFYIGRLYYHSENEFEPYSRESTYYPTRELAESLLEENEYVQNFKIC